ncbi:hypothetical protein CHRY9390_00684 [Chryseobacterium aquaeductus]|uniref:HTTM domain-containing protein n=1 Tax=Chryseobacterium aquaeductus TaxID=2675056 RepID=A0A9N8MED1_9FLAO|nr:hypothetical protein [Chryseobacterium aquaeductus]CAA7330035.1 hypothetical protein CHRY9390_00684 [Chryseobacterium potabilaquae]CAD7800816.1 hypothetical protein CHRY9390_00684 [Chryseobacterium aquaeductus]
MKYPQLTVFNFKVSYYLLRIFGLYWLCVQYFKFKNLRERPVELNEPVFWLQKIIFPEYPSQLFFISLLIIYALVLVWSFLKPAYILNVFIFLLTAIISLPISANYGVHHDNHLIILGFFLSIFLLPKKLESKDYKLIQYFYLGILSTYTMAGMWKIIGTAKNIIKQTDKVIWIDKNAAKLNTYDNYYRADELIPDWMKEIYAYENVWVILTVGGIFCQFLCFLGAFNRKLLTFFMIFLFIFHWYTMKFVLADFEAANYFILVILFPYHIFSSILNGKFSENYLKV